MYFQGEFETPVYSKCSCNSDQSIRNCILFISGKTGKARVSYLKLVWLISIHLDMMCYFVVVFFYSVKTIVMFQHLFFLLVKKNKQTTLHVENWFLVAFLKY